MTPFDPTSVQPAADLLERHTAPAWRRFAAAGIDAALLVIPTAVLAVLTAFAWIALRFPVFTSAFLDEERDREQTGVIVDFMAEHAPDGMPVELYCAYETEGRDAAVDRAYERGIDELMMQMSDADPREHHRQKPDVWVIALPQLAPGVLVRSMQFGFAALYFSLLGSGGRRTVGKWAMGLEVVHLSGRPPKVLEAYLRFMAYFITVGSGFGLLAYLREPNGRTSHDRLANTVVLLAGSAQAPHGPGRPTPSLSSDP